MSERVLLVEPFIKGDVGHFAGVARRIAQDLLTAGASVRVLGPADAPVAEWEPACELVPSWPESPGLRERFWARYPLISQARNVIAHALYARRVRACLARSYAEFNPDVVVVLSTTPSEIYGLSSAPAGPAIIACVHTVNHGQRIARIGFERFLKRCTDGSRFALGVFTDDMARSYEAEGVPERSIVRLTYPRPEPTCAPVAATYEPGDRIRAVYAGDARLEKGFLLLAANAERLSEFFDLRIQCSPPVVGSFEPVIAQAVDALRALDSDRIELVFGVLSEQDFSALIASGHTVLIPYDPSVYRGGRLSGITLEALTAGIPLLISDGWEPAREIKKTGAGVTFEYGNAGSLLHAAAEMRDDYTRYRDAAALVAADIAARDPGTDTVSAILEWATPTSTHSAR